jgi:hypothetical protein
MTNVAVRGPTMRSLPVCLLLAFLSALPCACNRGDKDAAVKDAAVKDAHGDAEFLEPALIPGGVADDQGKVGYVANPKGGIDAVDLESGKRLWHSALASYPLLVHEKRLFAQDSHDAGSIRIVTLDLATGNKVKASDPIRLAPTPEELKALEQKNPRTPLPTAALERKEPTFASVRLQQGQLHVIWRWRFDHFLARVDLATGKVEKSSRTPGWKRTPPIKDYTEIAKIAADPDAFGMPHKLPKLAKLEDVPRDLISFPRDDKFGGGVSAQERWVAGDVLALLVYVSERRSSRTLLVLWDVKTGKNLQSSDVMRLEHSKNADDRGTVFPAFQGRYVVRATREDRRRTTEPRQAVAVFSLESRTWSPTIWLESDAGNIRAAGSRLLFTSAGTLKAVDLAPDMKEPPPQSRGTAPTDAPPRILWERPVLLPPYGLPSWEERREP